MYLPQVLILNTFLYHQGVSLENMGVGQEWKGVSQVPLLDLGMLLFFPSGCGSLMSVSRSRWVAKVDLSPSFGLALVTTNL